MYVSGVIGNTVSQLYILPLNYFCREKYYWFARQVGIAEQLGWEAGGVEQPLHELQRDILYLDTDGPW